MRQRNSQVDLTGKSSQLLLDAQEDGVVSGRARFGKYNEQFVVSSVDMSTAVTEANYFCVRPLFVVTPPLRAAFDQQSPWAIIRNHHDLSDPAAVSIILDHLLMIYQLPGGSFAGATAVMCAVVLDVSAKRTLLDTEFGTNTLNPNGAVSIQRSAARITQLPNFTNTTVASSASRMVVGQRALSGAAPVVGDHYYLKFGGVDAPMALGTNVTSLTLNNLPPVIIPPGWCALIHLWFPSTTNTAGFQLEMGWWER